MSLTRSSVSGLAERPARGRRASRVRTSARAESEPPMRCPYCASLDVARNPKQPQNAYWRCRACGQLWHPERMPQRPGRGRQGLMAASLGRAQPRIAVPRGVDCPRCGRATARIIGRSEVAPVVYLRCDGCHLTSIAAA